MNTTPLFQIHEKLNAKFTEFNGWNMPLWFSSLEDEHLHVRDKIGIFDVSHMGEIEIVGEDAESFTDFVFTNNILNLKIGQARYGFICDFDAQVLDDVIVYKISNKRFFLCVNAKFALVDVFFMYMVEPESALVISVPPDGAA